MSSKVPRDQVADGSGPEDRPEPTEIDRTIPAEKWRYTCPNDHSDWDLTNNHLWCPTCARQNEHGEDVDPEHYEVKDQVSGELIPWSAVEVVTWEDKRLEEIEQQNAH